MQWTAEMNERILNERKIMSYINNLDMFHQGCETSPRFTIWSLETIWKSNSTKITR